MEDLFEDFTLNELADLRRAEFSEDAQNDAHIVPGVYLSWDNENADVSVMATSAADSLIALDAKIDGTPRWFSLNFELGNGQLAADDVLGIVIEGFANAPTMLSMFLRAAIEDDLIDTHFNEALKMPDKNGLATAFHTLHPTDPIGGVEGFQTLVIQLPPSDAQLTFRDARLFRVPASRGLSNIRAKP